MLNDAKVRVVPGRLNVRGLDVETTIRIRDASRARGLSYGDYFGRVARLHEVIRARADAGDDGLQAELVALGLETVHG